MAFHQICSTALWLAIWWGLRLQRTERNFILRSFCHFLPVLRSCFQSIFQWFRCIVLFSKLTVFPLPAIFEVCFHRLLFWIILTNFFPGYRWIVLLRASNGTPNLLRSSCHLGNRTILFHDVYYFSIRPCRLLHWHTYIHRILTFYPSSNYPHKFQLLNWYLLLLEPLKFLVHASVWSHQTISNFLRRQIHRYTQIFHILPANEEEWMGLPQRVELKLPTF